MGGFIMRKKFYGALVFTILLLLIVSSCDSSIPGKSKFVINNSEEKNIKGELVSESNTNSYTAISSIEDYNSVIGSKNSNNTISKSISGTTDKMLDKIIGYGNTEFEIKLPEFGINIIDAAEFGMDPGKASNSSALAYAFQYCAKNPNTKLNIKKGVYKFESTQTIQLSFAKNIMIDGNGSEFIFSNAGYLKFYNCDIVQIQNLTIDWDWEKERLASVGKVVGIAPDRSFFDFEFPEIINVSTSMKWETMNQCDPVAYSPGTEGGREYWKELLTFDKVEKIANNRLRVYPSGDGLRPLKINETFIIRHFTYGGVVFDLDNSSNVSIKGVTIYSAPATGFYVHGGSNHYQLFNCKIILKPDTNRHITTTVDALHISNTKGYMRVENCEFSYSGDDCMNINDDVATLLELIDSDTCTASNSMSYKVGDTIRFRRNDFTLIDFEAKIINIFDPSVSGIDIQFNKKLPAEIVKGAILSNMSYDSGNYVIRGNYFHENRARGLLLRANNGLVENNRLYKTQGAAILIQIDIAPLWSEGTGIENLMVRNNIIDTCNVNDWGALVEFGVNISGKIPAQPVFKNITFEKNQFLNFPSRAFTIYSAENVYVVNNIFKNNIARLKESPLRETFLINNSRKVNIIDNNFYKSPYIITPMQMYISEGSISGEFINTGNKIIS